MAGGSGFTAAYSEDTSLLWKGYKIGNDQPTSKIAVDGSATFAGTVTAPNITAFRSALTTAATNATTLADLKTAIIDALTNL